MGAESYGKLAGWLWNLAVLWCCAWHLADGSYAWLPGGLVYYTAAVILLHAGLGLGAASKK